MIGIIDYAMGNLRSVQKAFEHVGASAVIMAAPAEMNGLTHLVLPGVGAFADGMEHLRQRGWIEPIKAFIASGRPFLGICLGMQLLFEGSEEDAPSPQQLVPGLGVLPGLVVKFTGAGRPYPAPAAVQATAASEPQPAEASSAAPVVRRLKVPHMGWNTIRWSRPDPLLAGLPQDAAVYFVHSYYPRPVEAPQDPITTATCDYGAVFTATLWRGNVWATQFHPEKSQRIGLRLLTNFAWMK